MNMRVENDPLMRSRSAWLLLLGSCVVLSACGSRDDNPEVSTNPTPRQFDVSIAVDDAPGPFDSVTAIAYYDVENIDCAPTQPISGAQLGPRKSLPVEARHASGNRYEATMLVNPFVDQNYYGKGICHWRVVALSVKGTRLKRSFSAMFPGDQLRDNGSFVTYFPKQSYIDAATPMNVPGVHNLNRFATPGDAFSINISAKEAHE
ncbi:hypothetical protein ABIE56_001041 [Luteibacter sp. 621]|uniref:hypothetical protein n=1 Tax=Luteibacter sp. 621 TaxID=3373916 RepID=UPI003D2117FF